MRVAIIIAGGESGRLHPIGDKYLIPFFDRSIFERSFRSLAKADFDAFYVISGEKNEEGLRRIVEALLSEFPVHHMKQKDTLKGMWNAVETGLEHVPDESQVVITSFGDVVGDDVYVRFCEQAHADPLIAVKKVTDYFPGGYVEIANGKITGIIEKPLPNELPSDYITVVLHYFPSAKALKTVIGTFVEKESGYEQSVSALLKEAPGTIFDVEEWYPIKYPWHVLDVWEMWSRSIEPFVDPTAVIDKSAKISGNVHIAAGVRVLENAVIKGPAYIGTNAIVATNALVRESHIGRESVVGFGTEIARSFIADHVWTHTNYVGDSIVCSNVSFGAGTVTGNLRLDEGIISAVVKGEKISTGRTKYGSVFGSGVRVGVNSSFMPGTYVGSDSFVGGGVVIATSIEANKFVYGDYELVEKDNTAGKLTDRHV